jgi:hypothetical protein
MISTLPPVYVTAAAYQDVDAPKGSGMENPPESWPSLPILAEMIMRRNSFDFSQRTRREGQLKPVARPAPSCGGFPQGSRGGRAAEGPRP